LNEDREVLELLALPALDYLLKDEATPVILILDALDESLYFSRPGGLQLLFNQLRDIKVPVVLLARTEFWDSRQNDFASSYGLTAEPNKLLRQKVCMLRLRSWDVEQIRSLTERYRNMETDKRRQNLDELLSAIDSGEYEMIYGDIPKRPLFLRFILESVAEQGIKRTGKARLIYDWIELKIRRDVLNPTRFGSRGRVPMISGVEETTATVRLAFKAMKIAANKMTKKDLATKTLELLPTCNVDELLLSDEHFKGVLDPTGIFLHTLLIPLKSTPEELEIGFAHRTYQEFFLALHIREHPEEFVDLDLPVAIQEHLDSIKAEGI
jgi:hypothetical protein